MDHRDAPRMVPVEGRPRAVGTEPRAEGSRFARLVTLPLPVERRLVVSRLGLAVVAGVLGLAAAVVGGSHVLGGMVRWLHGQPAYQTTFGAIELDPEPPPWYRGGTAAFLDEVRRGAQRGTEPFSALDLELAELLREFRLYCWVKRAVLAERKAPNRLIVHLEYRTPVARVAHQGRPAWLLDAEGVILPPGDITEEMAGRLLRIEGLDPPAAPRPGLAWKSDDPGEAPGQASPRLLAAVRLAAWLEATLRREPKPVPPALRAVAIICGEGKDDFFVENAEKTLIYWPQSVAPTTPWEPTAAQRWADLRAWVRQRGAATTQVLYPYYLRFTKDRVLIQKGQ